MSSPVVLPVLGMSVPAAVTVSLLVRIATVVAESTVTISGLVGCPTTTLTVPVALVVVATATTTGAIATAAPASWPATALMVSIIDTN